MDRNDMLGAAQIAGGGYLGYQGVKHGLPRALGLRIEYHTTSKENGELIRKAGNFLDPSYGGKNGWASKVKSGEYIQNCQNFVHITGVHKDASEIRHVKSCISNKLGEKISDFIMKPYQTLIRNMQCIMYRAVGNVKDINELKLDTAPRNKKEFMKIIVDLFKKNLKENKTTRFCIPGVDSYFNSEFIADVDDIALKSSKKLKVYNNRFSATIAGLKKFGLKGMKENKGRVAFGIGVLSLGTYSALKLIQKGINNFKKA